MEDLVGLRGFAPDQNLPVFFRQPFAASRRDDEADYGLPVWAGVVPVCDRVGTPEDGPRLASGIAQPVYLSRVRIG